MFTCPCPIFSLLHIFMDVELSKLILAYVLPVSQSKLYVQVKRTYPQNFLENFKLISFFPQQWPIFYTAALLDPTSMVASLFSLPDVVIPAPLSFLATSVTTWFSVAPSFGSHQHTPEPPAVLVPAIFRGPFACTSVNQPVVYKHVQ